ncbi:unnamed protein product [Closterium sp. NIES-54]
MARPVFDSKYPASHVPRQLQAALVVSVVVMLAVLTMHNANMTARSYAIQEDLNRTTAFEQLLDRRFQEISVLAYEWGEQNFLKPHFHFDSILDAGANIGLTSVLFATMFPKATIISVEASSRNFRSLKLNTQPFPNVIAVNAALWPRVASLSLTLGQRNPELPPEWAFMVKETRDLEPGQVVEDSLLGVTVPFLLKVFGLPGFDFLKIDIEGSEGEIFREDREMDLGWVNESKLAALELHGDMVPGSNVTVLNFFNSRSNFHHKKDWSGEYEVFMRNDANLS